MDSVGMGLGEPKLAQAVSFAKSGSEKCAEITDSFYKWVLWLYARLGTEVDILKEIL